MQSTEKISKLNALRVNKTPIATIKIDKKNQLLMTYKLSKKKFNIKSLIFVIILIALIIGLILLTITISYNWLLKKFEVFPLERSWLTDKYVILRIIVASIGLSLATYIVQQITNNRLADVSILGISSVNILVIGLMLVSGFANSLAMAISKPWIILISSSVTALVIFGLSYKKNENISTKFVLSGIIINFTFIGLSPTLFSVFDKKGVADNVYKANDYINGAIPIQNSDVIPNYDFYVSIALAIVGVIGLVIISKKFFATNTNYLVAKSLGIKPTNIYFAAVLIAAFLTASSFMIVGNLSFLGIAAGNIAFFIFKKKPISGIVAALLLGLFLLVGVNFVASNLIARQSFPTTAMIALLVAPLFIFITLKKVK